MKKIAIIPARGGSKRIPRKNIKPFLGRPMIAYSIEAALQSNLFDEVMVSTDDEEIAEISRQLGAKVPFLRGSTTSNDFATTLDVLKEVIHKYRSLGEVFEYGCCIYPTAPLIKISNLQRAYDLLINNDLGVVFPVLKYSYPIWRSFRMEGSKAIMNWPEHMNARSQDLIPSYHDAGQFYWFNTAALLKANAIFDNQPGVIELEETEVQDIDNVVDWKMAEIKYQYLQEGINQLNNGQN